MIVTVIVACEVGFWVLIALGLFARYVLRRPRLGATLLVLVPVVDVVLLVATAIDLRSGSPAQLQHAIAALYLGFSVAYGHAMMRWADVRFAHWFAGGPRPRVLTGAAYTRHCWVDVGRTTAAVGIAAVVLLFLAALAGESVRDGAFGGEWRILGIIFVVDLLWAVSYTLWPRPDRVVAVPEG